MRKIAIVFSLFAIFSSSAIAIVPDNCPIPQHETCPPYSSDPNGAQSCQARNRNEDARYWQCEEEVQRARQREREEQQRKEHDKYCQKHPDANDCK